MPLSGNPKVLIASDGFYFREARVYDLFTGITSSEPMVFQRIVDPASKRISELGWVVMLRLGPIASPGYIHINDDHPSGVVTDDPSGSTGKLNSSLELLREPYV